MHYIQAIAGDKDMKDALAKLDKLTTVETNIGITDTFVTTQRILEEVQSLRFGLLQLPLCGVY